MQVNVVKIGNSKGIRIPKKILDQCQVDDVLDLNVENNVIVLKPVHRTIRQGWAESIALSHKKHGVESVDQAWLEADLLTEQEVDNWEW